MLPAPVLRPPLVQRLPVLPPRHPPATAVPGPVLPAARAVLPKATQRLTAAPTVEHPLPAAAAVLTVHPVAVAVVPPTVPVRLTVQVPPTAAVLDPPTAAAVILAAVMLRADGSGTIKN